MSPLPLHCPPNHRHRAASTRYTALGAAVYFLLAGLMRLEEMGLARDLMKRILKRG